jgi:hypothetical protein
MSSCSSSAPRWSAGARATPTGFSRSARRTSSTSIHSLDERIDGLAALTRYYDGIRGKVSVERHEMVQPRVQLVGGVGVLTFRFVSYGGNEDAYRWNCTEVYRRDAGGWRIIQTHWSFTQGRRAA